MELFILKYLLSFDQQKKKKKNYLYIYMYIYKSKDGVDTESAAFAEILRLLMLSANQEVLTT